MPAPLIYGFAAVACVVAPALGKPPAPDPSFVSLYPRIVWSFVLLAGLPMAVMALLLAAIHVQQRLSDSVYRTTAFVWTVGSVLLLAPLQSWFWPAASTLDWIRACVCALVAGLFIHIAARGRQHWLVRTLLAIGFGCVAMFFCYRAGLLAFVAVPETREATSDRLAEFFIDAVLLDTLVLLSGAGAWIVRRRVADSRVG